LSNVRARHRLNQTGHLRKIDRQYHARFLSNSVVLLAFQAAPKGRRSSRDTGGSAGW
jgi:hypothetical protein